MTALISFKTTLPNDYETESFAQCRTVLTCLLSLLYRRAASRSFSRWVDQATGSNLNRTSTTAIRRLAQPGRKE